MYIPQEFKGLTLSVCTEYHHIKAVVFNRFILHSFSKQLQKFYYIGT